MQKFQAIFLATFFVGLVFVFYLPSTNKKSKKMSVAKKASPANSKTLIQKPLKEISIIPGKLKCQIVNRSTCPNHAHYRK